MRNKTPALLTHRSESWRWDLLDLNDNRIGTLTQVSGGNLEFSVHNTIRGGGSLTWNGRNAPDWLLCRVQPWYSVSLGNGEVSEWPLGVFIPAAPVASYGDDGPTVTVELYDKLLVLSQDMVERTYTVAAGVTVTTAVRNLITGAGEEKTAIQDSSETLSTAMVWEAGTTKLQIINDLLASINYFALWVDGYGTYRGTPYVAPGDRGTAFEFLDDQYSIYSPDFTHDQDTFNVPNKVILVSTTDGEAEALSATATNQDPDDQFSYVNRGRWLTHFQSDVEATSQTVLNAIAERRLKELADVSSTFEISFAHIPLELNDMIRLRRGTEDIDIRATIQSLRVETSVGALVQATVRETK